MSRLTDLLAQVTRLDPELSRDLNAEVKSLKQLRSFGLNFERHQPEAVELPGRSARRGDKVRVLSPRGSSAKGASTIWQVVALRDGLATLVRDGEQSEAPLEDLVVVSQFRDPIYPGLVQSDDPVRRGAPDKPAHTVINAENFHALEALTYTHEGKVDAIYIDPPYNTGAKDWKYNNDYVDSDDAYRHSKWLAMMERRLLLAKRLLNPENSVLIVTIDEKEYLRLGLLLQQVLPEANLQMISSVINRKGVVRTNELARTNEFIYVCRMGDAQLVPERQASSEKVRWASLRRFEDSSRRNGPQPRPDQFYPIYVGRESGRIERVGDSILPGVDRTKIGDRVGCETVWPLKPDGTEMIWGLTPATLRKRLEAGFVKVSPRKADKPPTLSYLTSGQVADVASGEIRVTGRDGDGSLLVEFATGKASLPTTQWDRDSHNAQSSGTGMLTSLLPARRFPFAKSLYAVEDVVRLAVANKPDAVILDFFAGSGTTAHAVMRLNKQDGGRRQCISVTNNEVSADEQKRHREAGLRPGDPEWEQRGICDYITKPRIRAAATGKTPDGNDIKGDYKFTDEFPMSDGFEENVEFFTLTYEQPRAIQHGAAFSAIAPLLWLKAGAAGRRIEQDNGTYDIADTYAILFSLDSTSAFVEGLTEQHKMAFIVGDDERAFQMVCAELPEHVEPVRLFESYLSNFRIGGGG